MTSNATRKKTTKAGAPNYCNLYKIECEENVRLQSMNAARKAEVKSLHNEVGNQIDKNAQLRLDVEQLKTEARRSLDNLQERNYYRRSARCWAAFSMVLLIGILAVAVAL